MAVLAPLAAEAETVGMYVQEGLIACWDGIENAGADVHDANATVWKDVVGGRQFVLTNVGVEDDRMTFAGPAGVTTPATSYGTLSAADTTATFGNAVNGTMEIVYASRDKTASAIILQAGCLGLSFGIWLTGGSFYILPYSASGNVNKPSFVFESGTATNAVSVRYTSGYSESALANGSTLGVYQNNHFGTTGNETVIGTRAAKNNCHFDGSIYCIRLYSRKLTDAEIAANHAVDDLRFMHGGPSFLRVTGSPDDLGSPSPAYGIETGLGAGATLVCSAPSWTNAAVTAIAECAGWKLYDDFGNVVSSGVERALTYVHPSPAAYRRLEWQWVQSSKVTAAAGANGSVAFDDGFYAVGSEIAATAVPDEGCVFAGWTGLPEGVAQANPLRFTLGDEPDGIALAAHFSPMEASYALDLTDGDQIIYVGPGCVHTVTEIVGNPAANLTVVGGGFLILPNEDFSTAFANLVIDGVMVQITTESQLGGGQVTILNNGGLRIMNTLTLNKTINVADSCVFDVPADITVTIRPNSFKYSGKMMTKTGAGTLKAQNYSANPNFNGQGHWIIEEGTLMNGRESNTSSAFIWYEQDSSGVIVEVHEGATFSLTGAAPPVVLRGGTLISSGSGYATGTGDVANPQIYSGNSSPDGTYLNGGITVLPSLDGRPSRILGNFTHFSQRHDGETVFDVREGAVLDVYSTLSPRLQSTSDADNRTVRKTGAGQLRLHRPIRAKGTLHVEEGELWLGRGARIDDGFSILPASASVTVHLEDGAAFNGLAKEGADPLLSTAEIWLDPSRYFAQSGARVESLPNYGTLGGGLSVVGLSDSTYFRTNLINGLPALQVSASGLLLSNYENPTTAVTVFVVARNSSWANASGKGIGGTPIQICAGNSTPGAPNMFHYSYDAADAFKVVFGSTTQTFSNQGVVPGDTTPFLNEAVWSGTAASFRQWWSDEAAPLEWSGTTAAAFGANKLHWVSIGAKCYTSGVYANRGNNAMVGHIGEVLVFNRVLSADETSYVRSYLQRKWFNSATPVVAQPANATVRAATIKVADGDSAALDLATVGGNGDVLDIAKTGEGRLTLYGTLAGTRHVTVEEGVLGLSSNRWRTFADIWVDSSDAGSITLEGDQVAAVANKGVAGGSFVPIANYSGAAGHTSLATADGRTYLSFPGNAGLVLSAYTNYESRITSPLCIYAVLERTGFVSEAGPFTLADGDASGYDSDVAHTFHYEDGTYREANTRITLDAGSASTYIYGQADTGVRFLDVFHVQRDCTYYSQITASVTPTNGPRSASSLADSSNHVNRVVLGGRMVGGILDGYTKFGSTRFDRGWKGRIGEFLVFSRPLSRDDESELLWYLYNKWLVGTDGGPLPEALGIDLAPDTSAGALSLTFADGTGLDHSASTVPVASLDILGSGDWTRTGPTSDALFDVTGALRVDGHLSFSFFPFPRTATTLIRYGSLSGTTSPNDWTLSDVPGRKSNASIRNHSGTRTVDLGFASGLFIFVE